MIKSQLQYKAKVFDQNPKAALFFEVAETLQTLQEVKKLFSQVQLLENIKGPQGDPGIPGKDGQTPTRDELLRIIVPLIHIPEDGKTPTNEELTMLIKPLVSEEVSNAGLITEDQAIGLIEAYTPLLIPDITPVDISPLEIANKINSLEGMIKLSALEKFPTVDDFLKEINDPKSKKKIRSQVIDMNDLRWHGAGLSTVSTDSTLTGNGTVSSPLHVVAGGGLTELVMTGVIDDSNVTFTTTASPTYMVINGAWYKHTGGAITFTYLAGTVTLSSAVGTGGALWGFA